MDIRDQWSRTAMSRTATTGRGFTFTMPPMLDLHTKPSRPLVAASVLASDFGRMAEDAQDALDKGADLLHVDVMDGHFVANLTMGEDTIRGLRRHLPETFLDVHLMVERPDEYIDSFAKAGANHFSFHLEVCHPFHPHGPDADELIGRIHDAGMTAGMVINPYTGAQPVEAFLERLDLVLVMSVIPGRGGQSFMPHVLEQARWLAERLDDKTRLEMDGGLDPDTAPSAVAAGVDVLVAGSSVFKANDRAAAIAALHGA